MAWYKKATAERMLKSGLYKGKKRVKKVKAKGKSKFEFRYGGKNIKRRTGYVLD